MPKTFRDVDAYVSARIRTRRKEVGLSQTALAEKLGLTFQQVQKYESGANRISAGCLYEISKALAVPIGYFFQDCESQKGRRDLAGPRRALGRDEPKVRGAGRRGVRRPAEEASSGDDA